MRSASTLLNAPVSEAAAKIVAEPASAGAEGDADGVAFVATFLLLHLAASIVRQAIVATAKRIPPRSRICWPLPFRSRQPIHAVSANFYGGHESTARLFAPPLVGRILTDGYFAVYRQVSLSRLDVPGVPEPPPRGPRLSRLPASANPATGPRRPRSPP